MKIGIVCPIGPLDRYGYQYNHTTVLENLSTFATRVYLCSSTRNRANVDGLLARFHNVEHISNENTWFDMDESGNEIFRISKVEHNINLTLDRCRQDGMDCAIQIHINQYVPSRNMENLRRLCQDMLRAERPFEWLYKRYQLGNRIFHTETRVPWMLNLQIDNQFHVRADSLHHNDGGQKYAIEHGDYRAQNRCAIVDTQMELTLQDLEAKQNFIRCYSELNPEANPRFDWNAYFPYFMRKFNAKLISNEPLDGVGQVIAHDSRKDFVSWLLLEHYERPYVKSSFAKRAVRFARRLL
jgi:hypothetical protein